MTIHWQQNVSLADIIIISFSSLKSSSSSCLISAMIFYQFYKTYTCNILTRIRKYLWLTLNISPLNTFTEIFILLLLISIKAHVSLAKKHFHKWWYAEKKTNFVRFGLSFCVSYLNSVKAIRNIKVNKTGDITFSVQLWWKLMFELKLKWVRNTSWCNGPFLFSKYINEKGLKSLGPFNIRSNTQFYSI